MTLTEKEMQKINRSVDRKYKKWLETVGIDVNGNFYEKE